MATQLAERPSRMTRVEAPGPIGKIQRLSNVKDVTKSVIKKPLTFQFICMVLVALMIDLVSALLSSFGFGFICSFLGLCIFTVWFHYSGIAPIKINNLVSSGATFVLELFPYTGAFPCITINVIYTYYSK